LPKENPWQADGRLKSLEGTDRNACASRAWKGEGLESHCELDGVRCAIKERSSLNHFSKYAKLHNLVSRLLRFLIAFPSILTLYKQVLAATDITLDPASDKPYTIITVTDSGVYPSTSAGYSLILITKGKEVSLIEESFTKSFCLDYWSSLQLGPTDHRELQEPMPYLFCKVKTYKF
jgi:hypothetical protein